MIWYFMFIKRRFLFCFLVYCFNVLVYRGGTDTFILTELSVFVSCFACRHFGNFTKFDD